MNFTLPNSRMRSAFKTSGIRDIAAKADALEAQGKKIIHMEIGRPDYDSPACAKDAAAKALQGGNVHYTDMNGTSELRTAIAHAMKRDYRMDVDANREIVVTVGAMEALASLFLSVLEPGDEVIVPTPLFPAYPIVIELADGVLKEVACRFEDKFRLRVEDIEAAITPKTKMILINTPNNPSGAVLGRKELEDIAALAIKHNILVVSDECYEKFLYEGEHLSIASLPGMREHTAIISAASKTFSMTGWRIGWIVLPPEIKPYFAKCHQHLTTCATSFAQAGVAEALYNASDDVKKMIAGYRERRDLIIKRLQGIDGFDVHMPQGAFYAFPSVSGVCSKLGLNATQFSSWLLENAGVATVPGDAFRIDGDFLRMAYCRPISEIVEAMDRIESAVSMTCKAL